MWNRNKFETCYGLLVYCLNKLAQRSSLQQIMQVNNLLILHYSFLYQWWDIVLIKGAFRLHFYGVWYKSFSRFLVYALRWQRLESKAKGTGNIMIIQSWRSQIERQTRCPSRIGIRKDNPLTAKVYQVSKEDWSELDLHASAWSSRIA